MTLLPLRHTDSQDLQPLPLWQPAQRRSLLNGNSKDPFIFPFLIGKTLYFNTSTLEFFHYASPWKSFVNYYTWDFLFCSDVIFMLSIVLWVEKKSLLTYHLNKGLDLWKSAHHLFIWKTQFVSILCMRIGLNSHSNLRTHFQSTLVTRSENVLEPGCQFQTSTH